MIQATAGRAYKAGVKIAFGTDAAVYPHGDNAKEFQYMVDAGMPPLFVLQAATTHAAELLKKSKDLGTVEAGKYADVIAVEGNPLDDIKLMQHVAFVMKEGQVYKEGGKPQTPLAQRGRRHLDRAGRGTARLLMAQRRARQVGGRARSVSARGVGRDCGCRSSIRTAAPVPA